MTEKLTILRIGHRGDGVADTANGPVYVPYALPGETVTVDAVPGNHPDRRHLIHIDVPSPEHVAPVCEHFGSCGGCALQHWALPAYREWKRGLVVEALRHAGLNAPVAPLLDAHGEGRRRIVLHGRRGTHDVLEVGFSAPRAHHIVPVNACPILAPGLNGALKAAWTIAEILKRNQKPLDIQFTATDTGLDVDVRGSGAFEPEQIAELARIAEVHRLARLTRHGELIVQRSQPLVTMGKARVSIPPGSFLQATAEGEATLARLVVEHLGKAKTVADLFAGVGTFALRIAEQARVTAADSEDAAINALQRAVATTQRLKKVDAVTRDLFRRPFLAAELKGFDAVVFDPPRQGAEAQARELAKSAVKTVVAVSCNPTTFARDVRLLTQGGYRLTSVTPVDQFRYSQHVEVVGALTR
jgi:23S rRNA (uracil1939-C5)-methyltransferase